MSKISENFWRSEFACRCGCGFNTVDIELCKILEDLRFALLCTEVCDQPGVEIVSACRCPKYNKRVGGKLQSMHKKAMAADVKVWLSWHRRQLDPNIVASYLERHYPDKYGIGKYDTFTHIDVRENKSRWDERTKK